MRLRSFWSCCILWTLSIGAAGADKVVVFHAADLSPLFFEVKRTAERTLGADVAAEAGGSQLACRKLSELGRRCDLLLVSDPTLLDALPKELCRWRIDFASNELVLGVGSKAKKPDLAERDWKAALLDPGTSLVRANEAFSPIGYRTLLAWKLSETGDDHLMDKLKAKCSTVVDDVSSVAKLLKAGEADYGVIYRSTAAAHAIRSIPLPANANLGDNRTDYSKASVEVRAPNGSTQTVRGAPILFSLTIPVNAEHPELGRRLAVFLLKRCGDAMAKCGLGEMRPEFHGSEEDRKLLRELLE